MGRNRPVHWSPNSRWWSVVPEVHELAEHDAHERLRPIERLVGHLDIGDSVVAEELEPLDVGHVVGPVLLVMAALELDDQPLVDVHQVADGGRILPQVDRSVRFGSREARGSEDRAHLGLLHRPRSTVEPVDGVQGFVRAVPPRGGDRKSGQTVDRHVSVVEQPVAHLDRIDQPGA
jgi:hypothetical protein